MFPSRAQSQTLQRMPSRCTFHRIPEPPEIICGVTRNLLHQSEKSERVKRCSGFTTHLNEKSNRFLVGPWPRVSAHRRCRSTTWPHEKVESCNTHIVSSHNRRLIHARKWKEAILSVFMSSMAILYPAITLEYNSQRQG